ncbi:uncharacterized protein LOC107411083 [Ziziphus jujuba]|uniref:Uncharacterized protein LOC107411083 n=1 Tax=Ziziphus jujuba TaxID=326968 RepID=A0A6P3ZH72_ZIZJJ|nr:uncharacterized protein LOC107411083 [Ziziphus jujuba]XP_048325114.2 uncharacterized protein LOC107411083 [Ziziphus jujuba]XP_048325115.2 uncharacterized protein LOC107411083 [Ziziphus jujuba]
MGRQLQRLDSGFGGNQHSGCMWGILHILDYHRWHNVKKMLPYKRHGGRRRVHGNGIEKRILENRDVGEVNECMDAEGEPLLVKQQSTESISRNKRSGKARTKSSSAKERGESHKQWILSFPGHRTSSVHHIEPSVTCLGETSTNETTPLIIPQNSGNMSGVEDLGNDQIAMKQTICQENCDKLMEADILEIFKANKEFFLKILQDPDISKSHVQGLKKSNIKMRLTKSRSFPIADSSQAIKNRTSTLKHKQNEKWLFPKGEKSLAVNQAQKSVESNPQKDQHMDSLPCTANDHCTSSTSPSLPHGSSNHGWNQLVLNRFRDIKQKIKHALKESNKKNKPTTIEAALQSVPFGGNEMSNRLEITIGQNGNEIDGSNEDISKRSAHLVRRTSSLNESLDRYTQLFETSFGRATKLPHSRSLRMMNEEKVQSSGHARKSSRRNLSLPDLDSICSFLNGASHDAFRLGMPIKTIVDHSQTKPKIISFSEPLNVMVEDDFQNSMLERRDTSVDIEYSAGLKVSENDNGLPATDGQMDVNESAVRESITHQEQEIGISEDPAREFPQTSQESIIETQFTDDVTSTAEFPMPEGSQLNPRFPHADESDSVVDIQNGHNTDSLPATDTTSNCENTENENNHLDNCFLHFGPDIMENADFNYVRNVIELSGFVDNEQLRSCHSLDQPLNLSLFEELEACFHDELECHEDEVNCDCDHQILFDLINETLHEMNEKSFTYFPRPFSFSCNTRSIRKGQHLLEEVWPRISSCLSLRPELDQSLDDVVARDLWKGDGWMNLQWETQIVALELEDMISEELLDELVACL